MHMYLDRLLVTSMVKHTKMRSEEFLEYGKKMKLQFHTMEILTIVDAQICAAKKLKTKNVDHSARYFDVKNKTFEAVDHKEVSYPVQFSKGAH